MRKRLRPTAITTSSRRNQNRTKRWRLLRERGLPEEESSLIIGSLISKFKKLLLTT
jgi:hypothetical protein